MRVFAYRSYLPIEAREEVLRLLKTLIVLQRYLLDKNRGLSGGVGTGFGQTRRIFVHRDLEQAAYFDRVGRLGLIGRDHDIIDSLVVYYQFPFAVIDESTCRVYLKLLDGILKSDPVVLLFQ